MARLLIVVGLAALVPGCTEGLRVARPVSYAETARKNYVRGVAELEDENYAEAVKYFRFVRAKFPFSRYATLAELRIADAAFAEERYLEAIDAYKLFARFHPVHADVRSGYVNFRICEAYVEQIPSDWFLVPPSYEKDQRATRAAEKELATFLKVYPRSRYRKAAERLHRQVLGRLAAHDLYVARFYLERDKPKGAIGRLERLLASYPGTGVEPEALYLLGRTFLDMALASPRCSAAEPADRAARASARCPRAGLFAKARRTFARLEARFSASLYAKKARLYLAFLDRQR